MALDFPLIDPVAVSVGPLVVRWYALAYLAGFLLGWKYVLMLMGESDVRRPNKDDIDDFIPWVILGVIFGGRFGYALFYNFDYYVSNLNQVFYIWQGGMAFHGGALGVILAMILFARVKKIPLLRLSDLVAAAVPIGLFFGRLANFVNGELYGRITDTPWAVKFPAGGFEPRHPSQLYESALEGLLLFLILFVSYRKFKESPGVVSGLFLIGYGASRIFVEFFREPDSHLGFVYEWMSMGQVLSVPMILFGLGLVVYVARKNPSPAH